MWAGEPLGKRLSLLLKTAMADYTKLKEASTLVIQYPLCNACWQEVSHDGDSWICPHCGTTWDSDAGEDEPGTLYEEWSGETLSGDPVSDDQALRIAARNAREQRDARLRELGIKPV